MDLILQKWAGLVSRWRRLWLGARGVRFLGCAWLRAIEVPREPRAVEIGNGCALDRGVVLLCSGPERPEPKIRIGARVYVNRHTMIDASYRIEIGEDALIGPFCYLTDHDHDLAKGKGVLLEAATVIGPRAWIGAHANVLKGVEIGADTVVGAGSVVTKSLPAGVVAAGVPAMILRRRDPHAPGTGPGPTPGPA